MPHNNNSNNNSERARNGCVESDFRLLRSTTMYSSMPLWGLSITGKGKLKLSPLSTKKIFLSSVFIGSRKPLKSLEVSSEGLTGDGGRDLQASISLAFSPLSGFRITAALNVLESKAGLLSARSRIRFHMEEASGPDCAIPSPSGEGEGGDLGTDRVNVQIY